MFKSSFMLALVLFLLLTLAAFGLYLSKLGNRNAPLGKSNTLVPSQGPTVTIHNHTFTVDIADTMLSRAKGLSGRDGLSENEGMLFLFNATGSYGFWMKDMKFPIDIIWVAGGRVVGFAENAALEPGKSMFTLRRYYPPEPVDQVFEGRAGTVATYGLQVGDEVQIAR